MKEDKCTGNICPYNICTGNICHPSIIDVYISCYCFYLDQTLHLHPFSCSINKNFNLVLEIKLQLGLAQLSPGLFGIFCQLQKVTNGAWFKSQYNIYSKSHKPVKVPQNIPHKHKGMKLHKTLCVMCVCM